MGYKRRIAISIFLCVTILSALVEFNALGNPLCGPRQNQMAKSSLERISSYFKATDFLKDYLDQVQFNPLLNRKEKGEVRKWFRELPIQEAGQRLFDLLLENRLKQLPDDIAMDVRRFVKSGRIISSTLSGEVGIYADTIIDASFSRYRNRVEITVRVEIQENIMLLGLKLHELEHLIKDLYVEKYGNKEVQVENRNVGIAMGMRLGNTFQELLGEAAAMVVEMQFFAMVPAKARKDFERVHRDLLNPEYGGQAISVSERMASGISDPLIYVQKMWEVDRYSPESALDKKK